MDADLDLLRRRVAALESRLAAIEDAPASQGVVLGKITRVATLPTAAGLAYAVRTQTATYNETEGAAVAFADGSATIFAAAISTRRVPVLDDRVLAIPVGDRHAVVL